VLDFSKSTDDEEEDVCCEDDTASTPFGDNGAAEPQDDDDLLQLLLEGELAECVELRIFQSLCEGVAGQRLAEVAKRIPNRTDSSYPLRIACGLFTYARFDDSGRELDKGKEAMSAYLKNADRDVKVGVLAEVYHTWRALDRSPRSSLPRFWEFTKSKLGFDNEVFDRARQQISTAFDRDDVAQDLAFWK